MNIEVQKVDHPSRVHLDIESEDIPAEVKRLEKLGAKVVSRVETWVVMEAPTGHRFCVVQGQYKTAEDDGADRHREVPPGSLPPTLGGW